MSLRGLRTQPGLPLPTVVSRKKTRIATAIIIVVKHQFIFLFKALKFRQAGEKTSYVNRQYFSLSEKIEFFTIGISVRISDRSLHREEQKKFHQKLPPVGIETRTSGSLGQCLTNWARQESVGQVFLKWALFVSCTTSHVGLCSFLEHDQ